LEGFLDALPLIAKIVNTIVVVALGYGIFVRRRPRLHMRVMITCFVVDVINVLVVEVGARVGADGEGAVEQGMRSFIENTFSLLNFHILVSVAAIVGYVIAVVTGRRLFRTGEGRSRHRKNALVFVVTRLLSFVTSFFV